MDNQSQKMINKSNEEQIKDKREMNSDSLNSNIGMLSLQTDDIEIENPMISLNCEKSNENKDNNSNNNSKKRIQSINFKDCPLKMVELKLNNNNLCFDISEIANLCANHTNDSNANNNNNNNDNKTSNLKYLHFKSNQLYGTLYWNMLPTKLKVQKQEFFFPFFSVFCIYCSFRMRFVCFQATDCIFQHFLFVCFFFCFHFLCVRVL